MKGGAALPSANSPSVSPSNEGESKTSGSREMFHLEFDLEVHLAKRKPRDRQFGRSDG